MKCPNCGYVSFDDAYLCTNCGEIIDADKLQNDFIRQITAPPNSAAKEFPRPKSLKRTISNIQENLDLISAPATGLIPARPVMRIAAYAIDWAIISFFSAFLLFSVFLLLTIFTNSQLNIYETLNAVFLPFYLFSFLLKGFYFVFFHSATGQTFGKLLCGIKVCDLQGEKISVRSSTVRFLGYYLCFWSLGLGFSWILFNGKHRGWHDFLAGTMVITKRTPPV